MLHIVHSINKKTVDEFTKREHVGFLLSNKRGNFLSLGDKNISQTQGLFFFNNKNWKLFKTIESIELNKEVSGIINNFYNIKRTYKGGTEETFNLFNNSMLYNVKNYDGEIIFNLDFREMFDFDDKGRIYDISEENELIIITYEKYSDHDLKELQKKVYLVINGAKKYSEIKEWHKKNYPYDATRGSKSEFYVYKALGLQVDDSLTITASFSHDKETAKKHSRKIMLNKDYFVNTLKNYVNHSYTSKDVAFNSALKALDDLLVSVDREERSVGIFAGFPWFNQFWSRDELMSLKALMLQEKYYLVKSIIMKYLDNLSEEGLIPDRVPSSQIKSIDAVGWLFFRIKEFISLLTTKKILSDYLSISDLVKIKSSLEKSIQSIFHKRMKEGLVHNDSQETWMDTKVANREGACIEIQALFLSMIKLHNKLAKIAKAKQLFKSFEKELKEVVKLRFYKNGELLDNIDGEHYVRPNIFLACYVYPQLLTKNEWKKAFDKALQELWLGWGGLSSISQKHPLFKIQHTGQNDLSYHNGDSWFFVNNLSALAMKKIDSKYYADKINKILEAGKEDLLFNGLIGCCSEVSSAKQLKSEGCFSQAWSAATFIELFHELKPSSL